VARAVFTLVLGLFMAGCSAQPGRTQPVATQPAGTTAVEATPTPSPAGPSPVETTESGTVIAFDGHLPLQDGRELRVQCIGTGGPAIILEGGGIDPSYDEWPYQLLDGLAELATTCAYSRAGGTGSTRAERPRTLESMLSDHQQMVDQLVANGVIEPPFILAGHSLGATLALAEAMSRLEDTAGLVISDGGYPSESAEAALAHCIDLGFGAENCQSFIEDDKEALDIGIAAAALARPVPDLPVAVISSLDPSPDCKPEEECRRVVDLEAAAMEVGWKFLGPQVTFTRVEGDHDGMLYTSRDQIVAIFADIIEQAGGTTP
jgi:pimeloyl-ACP methyl ester carboxylesterase